MYTHTHTRRAKRLEHYVTTRRAGTNAVAERGRAPIIYEVLCVGRALRMQTITCARACVRASVRACVCVCALSSHLFRCGACMRTAPNNSANRVHCRLHTHAHAHARTQMDAWRVCVSVGCAPSMMMCAHTFVLSLSLSLYRDGQPASVHRTPCACRTCTRHGLWRQCVCVCHRRCRRRLNNADTAA